MSLVNSQDYEEVLLEAFGYTEASMDIDITQGFKLKATGKATASMALSVLVHVSMATTGLGVMAGFMRVNAEPNQFLTLHADGVADAQLALAKTIDLSLVVNGASSASMNVLKQSNSELDRIHFILDITPVSNASRYREYTARLKRNGSVLPISSFNLQRASVRTNFTARLARLSDRASISRTDSFKFEIAETILGTTTWRTIFDTGTLSSNSYSIGMDASSPTDTFTISISDDLTNKLSKCPLANTVYYDPLRTTIETTAVQNLYDTTGRVYASQVIGLTDMTLRSLLHEVFVVRCGFSQVVTNLSNYPIKRADFPASQSYYQSMKGILGVFDLSITTSEDGTKLFIRNLTAGVPAGFPAPRSLVTTDYKSFEATSEITRIHGIRLNYISNDTELTYKVQRLIQKTNDLGNGLEERIEDTVFDFFSLTYPTTLIKTLSDLLKKRLYQDGQEISYESERFTYDSANRVTNLVKQKEGLLPSQDINGNIDETLPESLQRFHEEVTDYEYSAHLFIPRAVYLRQALTRVSGLLVTDADNQYLLQDFKQPILEAHTAGNIKTGFKVTSESLETIIENFEPQKNGEIKSSLRVIKHYRNNLTSSEPQSSRVGDGSLLQAGSSQQTLLVFEDDAHSLSGEAVLELNGGEMPLYLLITEARNKLKRLKNALGTMSADVLGIDLDLREGTPVTLKSRANETQGAIIIKGDNIRGTNLGTESEEISQTVEGERILV